ncbi:hypothetical protein IV902_003770 [Salmonella enterica subsp. enterica serovar Infantis]|nr:hypothetical protein [Salmonella enterica subsp. enterica serovar Infantis]
MSDAKIITSGIITLPSDENVRLQHLAQELKKQFASQPEEVKKLRVIDEIEPFSKEFLAECRK